MGQEWYPSGPFGATIGTDTYPAEGSEDTSREAYASLSSVRGPLRRLVYGIIVENAIEGFSGCTAHELETLTKLSGNTIRPRLKELERDGFVRKGTLKRATPSGRMAIVWEPVQGRVAGAV